jgi:hypothetical protein
MATPAATSEFTITTKDDVEWLAVSDSNDKVLRVEYWRWVLGSVHEDDALYRGTLSGGPVAEHSLEQIQRRSCGCLTSASSRRCPSHGGALPLA